MAYAKMNGTQMAVLRAARGLDEVTLKAVRAAIFEAAKKDNKIPSSHRVRVEIDDTAHADYAVLIRKTTGAKYQAPATAQWRWARVRDNMPSSGVMAASYDLTNAPVGTGFTIGTDRYIVATGGAMYKLVNRLA